MSEGRKETQNLRTFDIGIKAWIKEADSIIQTHGYKTIVNYPSAAPIMDIPLLTFGAHTCYAGVAQSSKSGLWLFHFYDFNAFSSLVLAIGGIPINGVYGGIPHDVQRSGGDQFGGTALKLLSPKDPSLGGLNIIASGQEVLYAAGYYDPYD